MTTHFLNARSRTMYFAYITTQSSHNSPWGESNNFLFAFVTKEHRGSQQHQRVIPILDAGSLVCISWGCGHGVGRARCACADSREESTPVHFPGPRSCLMESSMVSDARSSASLCVCPPWSHLPFCFLFDGMGPTRETDSSSYFHIS